MKHSQLRPAWLLIVGAAVAFWAIAVWSGDTPPASAGTGSGLSFWLRTGAPAVQPGGTLPLTLDIANVGSTTQVLHLGCDPATDFQVRNAEGDIVWRLNPDCVEVASELTLAPGDERSWNASWPGETSDGSPAPEGRYYVYASLRTMPIESVIGPVVIEVDEEAALPTEVPKPTKTPKEKPEPTEKPPETKPSFPVTDKSGRQVRPDVAGHPEMVDCQNLVVWWDETQHEVWGRFVEPEWKGEAFKVSGDASAEGPPKVAYNHASRRWLVVWASGTDAGPLVIRGRYVQCAEPKEEVFVIGLGDGVAPPGDDQPAVADHGEHFAVVWRRAREGGEHQMIGANVVGLGWRQIAEISESGDVAEPAIDCEDRGDCLVAWTRGSTSDSDVVGRYWFPREEYVGSDILEIAATDLPESYPSVAWNGWYDRGAYAVTWTEDRRYPAVLARTVYPTDPSKLDTYVLSPAAIEIESIVGGAYAADVASLGPDFVVVWAADPELGAPDIYMARLKYNPDGRTLTRGDVVNVSDLEPAEGYPAVASALDPLTLSVWQIEWENGSADIMGRHVALSPSKVSLLGVVGSRSVAIQTGSPAQEGAPLEVIVRRVLAGSFDCSVAEVYETVSDTIDPMIQTGDMVSLRADPAPDYGSCALVVGPPGTYLLRSSHSQLCLPYLCYQ